MRFLASTTAIWLLGLASSFAEEEGASHGLPAYAPTVFKFGPIVITNSMVMVWIVAALIIVVAQIATKKLSLIPAGLQNFAEWLVESLYNFLEGILGEHLVKRTFWFFGTIFVLILCTNWFGLIPGVGTLVFDGVPILRGANADLNMTASMSVLFAVMWLYWALSENGVGGFFNHIFAPKGKFTGVMKLMMIVIFFLVGCIEVASIALRPVALSFRLYGNIFAGENILENMIHLGGKWFGWLTPLPFYFMELLVGLIQALVFTMLTSVFLKLICDHDHEDDHAQ